jgi:hypothetical protein
MKMPTQQQARLRQAFHYLIILRRADQQYKQGGEAVTLALAKPATSAT